MSTRDKLCLIGIALLLLVGAPLAFGLLDPLLNQKPRVDGGSDNSSASTTCGDSRAGTATPVPGPETGPTVAPIKAGCVPIKLSVVSATSKQPVAAWIKVQELHENRIEMVGQLSAADGHFFVEGCNANRAHVLIVSAHNFVERRISRPPTPEGQIDDCGTIALEPLFGVRLRIRGEHKELVEIRGQRVWPMDSMEYLLPWEFETVAGPGQDAQLQLPRGTWATRILTNGVAIADDSFTVTGDGQAFDLVPALAGAGSIRVNVLDWTGSTASSFRLELARLGPGDPVGVLCSSREAASAGIVSYSGLPAGRYELTQTMWASFYGNTLAVTDRVVSSARFQLDPGQQRELAIAAPAPCELKVRVFAYGVPVPQAEVWLHNGAIYSKIAEKEGRFWPSAKCDENGVATFADVAPGRFGIGVAPPLKGLDCIGGTPKRFPGQNVPWEHETNGQRSKTVDIELFDPACATLVGVVRNGADWANSFRLLAGGSGKEVCTWTSDSAGFTLGSVPLGSYVFEARCGDNNAMVFPLKLTRTGCTFIEIDAAPHTLRCVSELAPGDDPQDLATMRARLIPELMSPARLATASAWINEELRFENVASGIYYIEVEFLNIQDRPAGWCSQRIEIDGERELRLSLKVDRRPPSRKHSQIRIHPRFSEIDQVRDLYGVAWFLNAEGFVVGRSGFSWDTREPDKPIRLEFPPAPYTSIEIEEVDSDPIVLDANDPLLRGDSVTFEFQPRRGTLVLVLEADDLRAQEAYESELETLDEDWGFRPFEGVRPVIFGDRMSLLVLGFRARGQGMRLKLPGFEAYEFHVPANAPFPGIVPIKLVRGG